MNGTGQVLPRGSFLGGSDTVCAAPGMAAPQALAAFPLENILVSVSPSMMSFLLDPSGWRGPMQVGGKAGRGQKQAGEGQLPSSPSWVPTQRGPARNTLVPELTPDICKLSCFQKKL